MLLDWTANVFDVIGADVMVAVSGEAPTSTPPTVPGLEFTMPQNRLHFDVPENRMQYTLPVNRLHFSMREED